MLRVLDLFSGIGGFSLGLESTGGFKTVAFCEVDKFCQAVLRKHWPDATIFDDVRELKGVQVGEVDVICGGFPCQDVSVAGKGAGIDGLRTGLVWELMRIVREVRPRWLLLENVPGIRTRGYDRVEEAVQAEGYSCWPLVVGADDVGAPHRRKRVWIVAYCDLIGRDGALRNIGGMDGTQCSLESEKSETWGAATPASVGSAMADTERDGRRARRGVQGNEGCAGIRRRESARGGELAHANNCGSGQDRRTGELWTGRIEQPSGDSRGNIAPKVAEVSRWPSRPGEIQHDWERPRLAQREMGFDFAGLSARLAGFANRNALRAVGNAVVPQVVAAIGRTILKVERQNDA